MKIGDWNNVIVHAIENHNGIFVVVRSHETMRDLGGEVTILMVGLHGHAMIHALRRGIVSIHHQNDHAHATVDQR